MSPESTWQTILPDRLWLLPESGFAANHYLLQLNQEREVALFEVARPPQALLNQLNNLGMRLTHLIATHGHFDHLGEADAWRKQTGLPLAIGAEEAPYLASAEFNGSAWFTGKERSYAPAESPLQEGMCLSLGDLFELRVWHTPGHTPGGCCFLLQTTEGEQDARPLALFTGDTIIGTSIGRTDFPGGDAQALAQSLARLRAEMEKLPPDLPILSGHGPVLTCEQVLTYNPWL